MLRKLIILGALPLALAAPAGADVNKLTNDKLKDEGFERLEGNNRFKPGCRHIIRSSDRLTVMHPGVLTSDEIGLSYLGKWVRVRREDKTTLLGANLPVTVWRKCSTI